MKTSILNTAALLLALLVGAAAARAQPAATQRAVPSPLIGSVEITPMLPVPFDRNMVRGSLVYMKESELLSGSSTIGKPYDGRIDSKVRTDRLHQPAGSAILRAQIDPDVARQMLGSAVAADAAKQSIALVAEGGGTLLPIGYVWTKPDQSMQLRIDRNAPIESAAKDLPLASVASSKGERFYLYWQVKRDFKIVRLRVGERNAVPLNLVVPP